jgi:nitroimidazol reductase NimA-like FMN-containing flavoprotein (pyridoxamine 5'-phosphate oxidase superfamily)
MTVSQLRVVVEVADYDAALTFFRDTLGLDEEAAFSGGGDERVAILQAGRATLELANPAHHRYVDEVEVGRPVAPRFRLAFEVADAAFATTRLLDGGAVEVAPPTRTPWESLNSRLDAPGDLHITLFQEPPPAAPDDLREMVRDVVDTNRYLTLGTVGADGPPRLTPVFYTHHEYRELYWVSSPDARHSLNLAGQPAVTIVIFDSTVDPVRTRAVYLDAAARQVPDDELPTACDRAFRRVGPGARAFGPEDLSGSAPLRLYRADVTSHAVHIRGGDPTYGTGIDARVAVTMP